MIMLSQHRQQEPNPPLYQTIVPPTYQYQVESSFLKSYRDAETMNTFRKLPQLGSNPKYKL